MKLRIEGESVRLRLKPIEVAGLQDDQHVSDSITFAGQKLIYTLQGSDVDTVKASFSGNFITIDVPKDQLTQWAGSDQVGIEAFQQIEKDKELHILIEKDFACLRPREGEEDLYPNPKANDTGTQS